MTPSSNASQKIITILTKLIETYELGNNPNNITLGTRHFLANTGVDVNEFTSILNKIESIAIIIKFTIHINVTDTTNQDMVCLININKTFKTRAEDYIEYLSSNQPKTKSTSGILLYLEKNGDFWHGDREKFCYKMGRETIPYKIMKFLAENNNLQKTGVIASILGDKKKRTVMNDIGEMKSKIKDRLQLDDVISNERPLGYRINPKYKIVITD